MDARTVKKGACARQARKWGADSAPHLVFAKGIDQLAEGAGAAGTGAAGAAAGSADFDSAGLDSAELESAELLSAAVAVAVAFDLPA